MASLILISAVSIVYASQAVALNPGDTISDAGVQAAAEAQGAVFAPASDANVAAAAVIVQKLRAKGANEATLGGVMLAAYASSAYAGAGGYVTPTVSAITGTGSAVVNRAIPTGVTAVLVIESVGLVTTKGGGSESVGDTYHLRTRVTVKNVGGTVSIVSNKTEVSITDADASVATTGYTFSASGANFVTTIANAAGLNAGTIVTHTMTVSEQDYAA